MFEQSSPSPGPGPSASAAARHRLGRLAEQARLAEHEPVVAKLVERWVPHALTRSPRRRRLTAALAVLAVVVLLAGGSILLLGGDPPAERAPVLPTAADRPPPAQAGGSAPGARPGAMLVVSVVGKVRSPGLVTLPAGARVADALRAAGDVLDGADVTVLNLARKLSDGEQINVGLPPVAAPAAADAATGARLDLNTASAEQLDALPGVGEVTARRIVDWRSEHGPFGSVEQLQEVDGIGATRFARLRDQVTVS
ncbi:ComEA family DNA-binding protein [Amycolatopsis cynarae]|uniref:ComEA family DNA-binding protein n=1 Tax=Amycolatopsis cynarae TaxID=2995223 RepID=A0ABY7AVU4_9PSEU|nr:ComEA family DNA-binding protein [Amycolatopsis sp. HUAS 11-8]WAL64071.1 ComEA family DNA-binding protein [Amycolatopsis sp. HUAS 11-8]